MGVQSILSDLHVNGSSSPQSCTLHNPVFEWRYAQEPNSFPVLKIITWEPGKYVLQIVIVRLYGRSWRDGNIISCINCCWRSFQFRYLTKITEDTHQSTRFPVHFTTDPDSKNSENDAFYLCGSAPICLCIHTPVRVCHWSHRCHYCFYNSATPFLFLIFYTCSVPASALHCKSMLTYSGQAAWSGRNKLILYNLC